MSRSLDEIKAAAQAILDEGSAVARAATMATSPEYKNRRKIVASVRSLAETFSSDTYEILNSIQQALSGSKSKELRAYSDILKADDKVQKLVREVFYLRRDDYMTQLKEGSESSTEMRPMGGRGAG